MKKLSIAIVLITASVSFAKAQSTDTAKVKMDTVVEVKGENAMDTATLKETTVEAAKIEDTAVKTEISKEEAKKARKEEKARAKEEKAD